PEPGDDEGEPTAGRRRRGRRGGRGRSAAREETEPETVTADEAGPSENEPAPEAGDEVVSGVVEVATNGSAMLRVSPGDASDGDIYISSAQVKRCELVSGDRVSGPLRAPRRSERFASLIRVDTVNDRPASELADGVRFDDLPAAFPSEQLALGSEDQTLKAIDRLTPFGRGSRVVIVGEAMAGKSHLLREIASVLAGREALAVSVALAGVRPEEISRWSADGGAPVVAAVSFAASEEARGGAVETAVDQARRLAARGAHAVVLIDTLDGVSSQIARRALGSARCIDGGGSLTVIATATAPPGGETTVISLDRELTSVRHFPAIDPFASWTLAPELLVGEAGADAIVRLRLEAGRIAAEGHSVQ
ncbi:MAG: Rho termination factor N-terminal domain-containing protein, partial [Solirubrobacteraceae bacterium]